MNGPAACIDIGSNSVLLTVSELNRNWIREIETGERITRLGSGLSQNARLSDEAMRVTCSAVAEFVAQAKQAGAVRIRLVGTQALRKASNSGDFLEMVRSATGLDVEIISGEEESRLSFLAADQSLAPGARKVVFDVGGGSTEVVSGVLSRIERCKSMALGCVLLSEQFPFPDKRDALRSFLDSRLNEELSKWSGQELVGIGGTATALAAIRLELREYDPKKVHGLRLPVVWISRFADEFASKAEPERLSLPFCSPARLKVLGPGIEIILALLRRFCGNDMVVSDAGLRHAVVWEMLARTGE